MDETESYLNSILKKRLGSVVNYGSSYKTANTVTRIPKQEQKIQSMPTVFRKKHETVYLQNPSHSSQYSHLQSQYMSMRQTNKDSQSRMGLEMPQQTKQAPSQRVEYMLISKRIQSKKQDQFISPTVDVTSYRKTVKAPQINRNDNTDKQYEYKSNIHTGLNRQSANPYSQQYHSQRQLKMQQENYPVRYDNELGSKISSNTDKSKRKKIF